jgi:hypothetical protein
MSKHRKPNGVTFNATTKRWHAAGVGSFDTEIEALDAIREAELLPILTALEPAEDEIPDVFEMMQRRNRSR